MIPEREPEKWLPHPRKAAGAKIPPLQYADGVTRNNDSGPIGPRILGWEQRKAFIESNWRASLVPAAAVIPAPVAYTKVAAVKKLVVEGRRCGGT